MSEEETDICSFFKETAQAKTKDIAGKKITRSPEQVVKEIIYLKKQKKFGSLN